MLSLSKLLIQCSSSMRAIARACQPEDSSTIRNTSEEMNEEHLQAMAESSKRDENKKVTTKENE